MQTPGIVKGFDVLEHAQAIPAPMQKNDTEEAIPLITWFEDLLLETPKAQRFGWCFNPMSLQTKLGRAVRHERLKPEWVSKIVSRIGERAGVIVEQDRGDGKPKFASAHDLRRSCICNMLEADIDIREVSKIVRHADHSTTFRYYGQGEVQQSAHMIRQKLESVPRYTNSQEGEQKLKNANTPS